MNYLLKYYFKITFLIYKNKDYNIFIKFLKSTKKKRGLTSLINGLFIKRNHLSS